MYGVKLSCGHIAKSVPWQVTGCEHSGIMACSGDPTNFKCKEVCGGRTTCCSRTCKSRCYECQKVTRDNAAPGAGALPPVRTHHKSHACERTLKCRHLCGFACSSDHSCNPKCSQSCQKECWEPFPPCMEPCEWRCPHHSCPVVCGSVSFHGRVGISSLETNL